MSPNRETYEKPIAPTDQKVVFDIDLAVGKTMLNSELIEGEDVYGVYYTYIEMLDKELLIALI